MLKNKDERRLWIDNFEENYSIEVDTGSVRILASKVLPDKSQIIVIQAFIEKRDYDFELRNYVYSNVWDIVDRFIKLPNENIINRTSPSDLVEHLKNIKVSKNEM